MKLVKYTPAGTKSTHTAADAVFAAKVNRKLLSQAARVYLANLRQGTSKVKTRAEVEMTKAKWYRQKGTGRARHGAQSAPIFVGGGVAHGPSGLANWSLSLPKKLRPLALISALSAQAEKVIVHAGLADLKGKTKHAAALINSLKFPAKTKILIVHHQAPETLVRAFRNLPAVELVRANDLNALHILKVGSIIFTPEAIKEVEARLA